MKFFHKITAFALLLTTSLIMVGCGGGSSSSTAATSEPTTSSTPNTSTTPSSSDSTSSSTIGQGNLSVYLTDAPAEFEAVYVTIAEVHVHRADTEDDSSDNESDDGEWIVIATPNVTYNLLELQDGITTFMGEDLIPSGDYTQLRLILGNIPDTTVDAEGKPHPFAHYITFFDESDNSNLIAEALKVPSNTVKYNHNFTILDGADMDMLIDFDAEKSIHPAGDKWILNPVIKVL